MRMRWSGNILDVKKQRGAERVSDHPFERVEVQTTIKNVSKWQHKLPLRRWNKTALNEEQKDNQKCHN